jgi:AcrR family transcriptional regulator
VSSAAEQPTSRRVENKLRTRRALREAALLLFATQGYEETTTEEIADAAGVSPRTLFRYFPTKDSLLYFREGGLVEDFVTDFLKQPDDLSELTAITLAFIAAVPGDSRGRRAQLRYKKAVESSAVLRGLEYDHQKLVIEMIADAIAVRRALPARDEASMLLAGVVALTYRRALDNWIAGPARVDAARVIAVEFNRLAELFGAKPPVPISASGTARPRRA